jgi:molecular chaperone GrpE
MEQAENTEQIDEAAENGQATETGRAAEQDGKGAAAGGDEVEVLKKELAESRERYVRLMADFENFKKRALKEQSELLKYQGERIVIDMLEVLDNLELALSHSSAEYDKLKTGLEMIQKLFVERLAKWDVRGESGIGAQFDPQKHSAISRVPGADAKPGTIVGELKKAYYYKDKLIRPGEVVVASEGDA